MSLTHQDVLDYKKRFDGCEYVELSREEFDVLLIIVEQSIPTCKVEEKQKPLTMEELAAIKKCTARIGDYIRVAIHANDFDRLLAAAERSYRRPIATAPRDGAIFNAWSFDGEKYGNVRIVSDEFFIGKGNFFSKWTPPKPLFSWLPIPGEGGG